MRHKSFPILYPASDNFSILETLVTVTEGNEFPGDAAMRLRNFGAPEWMVRGLMALDTRAEIEPEFGFTVSWFGDVALDPERLCCEVEQPEGNC